MALVFNSINVEDEVRGTPFNYKASVVASSAADSNWTTSATLTYSAPTLTITGLTNSGGSRGELDTVDTLEDGDRILIKDAGAASAGAAADNSYNGIWEITGGSATSITCIRTYDLLEGDGTKAVTVWVKEGALHGDSAWISTTNTTVLSGTNAFTFTQYDVVGTLSVARGGTNVTTFGGTNTLLYTTSADTLSSIATANNAVLVTDGSGAPSLSTSLPTAVQNNIDHGNLTGLLDDDHTQYALLAGRSGGQTLIGGSAAGEDLILQSTSNATRGTIQVNDDLEVDSIDALTATTMTIGGATATKLDLGASDITTDVLGALTVLSTIDTAAAGALSIGTTTATSIEIAQTGVTTDINGLLTVVAGSGGGIDASTAGALVIGESTATSVVLADTGVTTIIEGPVTVEGSIDTISASTLTIGPANATSVQIADTGVVTQIEGPAEVEGSIDTITATTLTLGAATATKVEIADTGVLTDIEGGLQVEGSIDTIGASTMTIGSANATKIEIGASDVLTEIVGDLLVSGTTTSVNTEVVNVADNHLYLNAGYTTTSAQTGGLVVNYLPTATSDTSNTGGFATTSTVNTTGAATFSPGDIIQISGAANEANNGIFEVLTHAANVLTIDTTPTEDFTQNTFTVDTGDTTAVITQVTVSIMRAGTDGIWETGSGDSVPITFTDLASATPRRSFSIISAQVQAISTTLITVGYFAWDDSQYGAATTRTIIIWADASGTRGLDIDIYDGSSTLGSLSIASGTGAGIQTFTFSDPGGDNRLEIRVAKDLPGGGAANRPRIFGVQMELS